jgi:hypothetical protein
VTVDRERFERLRRLAAVRTSADMIGRLLTYSVGDHVWARWGRTSRILLGRVLSAHPIAMAHIDGVRDWWELSLFSNTHLRWVPKPTFRRIFRVLTPTEIRDLKTMGVVEEAGS